ncbi:hypothetical protein JHK82_016001 [Glycine max]|nr:hypothetical protein JHK85_016400 [Glycine max]KAG5149120.1 hypothetical protein JHK82_016001 [Glycine max]
MAELLDPTLKGILNVLKLCVNLPTLERVVLTSFVAADLSLAACVMRVDSSTVCCPNSATIAFLFELGTIPKEASHLQFYFGESTSHDELKLCKLQVANKIGRSQLDTYLDEPSLDFDFTEHMDILR